VVRLTKAMTMSLMMMMLLLLLLLLLMWSCSVTIASTDRVAIVAVIVTAVSEKPFDSRNKQSNDLNSFLSGVSFCLCVLSCVCVKNANSTLAPRVKCAC
jgi:hypothetical protein